MERPAFECIACIVAVNVAAGVDAGDAPSKPDVIVILTDDQGSADAGCYGAKDLAMPAIDSLAARGIRFTRFYAGAPVCSPSRAALMTGKYPPHARLTGNAASQRGKPGRLPVLERTMAEMFRAAGHATAHAGKRHLGYRPETMPNARGFDRSFGHRGGCIDSWSHFFYRDGPNVHDLWRDGKEVFADERSFAGLMVEEAGKFMEVNRDRPFFLYWKASSAQRGGRPW